MKVVGTGLNKTGTKTLRTCLQYWGLRHVTYNTRAFDLWRKSDFSTLMQWVKRNDSFEDWPWPLMYREIDQAFPETKFILTTRIDADTWFRSLCKQAERTGPTEFRKYIYGHAMPEGYKDEHIKVYESHNNAVREYFSDRSGKLLEICWEKGHGWKELADFLGFPDPGIPLPHLNSSSMKQIREK